MTNSNNAELLKLEAELDAERAYREALPLSTPDDDPELLASYERSDALERKILATPATSQDGYAVKLCLLEHQLRAEGCVWAPLESLKRDLGRSAQ